MDDYEKPQNTRLNVNLLLNEQEPLPNDDPRLKEFIAERGKLYKNTSIIGLRPASEGEVIETWIRNPNGSLVLERSTVAKKDDVVAVGVLGETYIPSKTSIEKNRLPIGKEGLRDDEAAPPLPDDGNVYELFRSNGQDYRLTATNPFDEESIYLRTSSGRLQTALPGGNIATQIEAPSGEAEESVADRLDVARFIGAEEFAASYTEATPDDYERFNVPTVEP